MHRENNTQAQVLHEWTESSPFRLRLWPDYTRHTYSGQEAESRFNFATTPMLPSRTHVLERSPLFYARVVGYIYLAAMALSMFTQVYVPGKIVVPGDVAATAQNIIAFEGLFRLGIVVDIVIFVSDVVIAWAFYELLEPVDGGLARLGAFLRIADAAVLAAVTLNGLASVRLLSGVDYLHGIDRPQLEGLARFFISLRGTGLYIGFVFLGSGSTLFAYLLFKSRY